MTLYDLIDPVSLHAKHQAVILHYIYKVCYGPGISMVYKYCTVCNLVFIIFITSA